MRPFLPLSGLQSLTQWESQPSSCHSQFSKTSQDTSVEWKPRERVGPKSVSPQFGGGGLGGPETGMTRSSGRTGGVEKYRRDGTPVTGTEGDRVPG